MRLREREHDNEIVCKSDTDMLIIMYIFFQLLMDSIWGFFFLFFLDLDLDLQNLPELKCERLVCSFSGSESSGLLRESPISGLGHVSIAASSAILK